jgi:hydroxymethylpyrimidine/phosphomethylpyrimidine kinase
MKTVLCIGGFDPTTGAGITSDCLTVYQNGEYPLAIITSITSQNANGVKLRYDLPSELVDSELKTLLGTHRPSAIKIGMLGNLETTKVIFEFLLPIASNYNIPIVLDPVIQSTSGFELLDAVAVHYLKSEVFKYLALITPNQMEYHQLFKNSPPSCPCLLKGGHLSTTATDILIMGSKTLRFHGTRIHAKYSHGTGCTLASAIATHMASGKSLENAIQLAKNYVRTGLHHPIHFDDGNGAMRK